MWKIAGIVGVIGVSALIITLRLKEDMKPQDIIARAIKVHGGAENLEKLKASVVKTKGQYYGFGEPFNYNSEISLELPDRTRTDAESKLGNFLQVINGEKGWVKLGDMTHECSKEECNEMREQMNAVRIAHLTILTGDDYKLASLPEETIDEQTAIGVRVQHKGYRDVNLFFDKEKGLLLKMQTRLKDPQHNGEEVTAETLYEYYKEVDGVMVAHKFTLMYDGKPHNEGEVAEVTFADKLDDIVFEKP